MGECPIILHDDEEYDLFRRMNSSAYVYVQSNTQIRISSSSNVKNLVAEVTQFQHYGTDGFPHFQFVEKSVISSIWIRHISGPQFNQSHHHPLGNAYAKNNQFHSTSRGHKKKESADRTPYITTGSIGIAKTIGNVFGYSSSSAKKNNK